MKFPTNTYLLMVSGGLDSTFMLYYFLKYTNYIIHVHHISQRSTHEPRWQQEDIAFQNIVKYCLNYRYFGYSTSIIDLSALPHIGGWDVDLQFQIAIRVCYNLLFVPNKNNIQDMYISVAIGCTKDDEYQGIEYESKIKNLNNFRQISRTQNNDKLWQACLNSLNYYIIQGTGKPTERINPEFQYPLIDLGYYKKDIIKDCPKDLFELTWSCRNSGKIVNDKRVPCGECHTCKSLKNARAEYNSNWIDKYID